MVVLVGVSLAGWSCAPRKAPARAPGPPVADQVVPAVPAPPPPTAPAAPPAASPCPPLGPNEVSEDETPSVAGTTGSATVSEWLAARGVSKAAFRGFVLSRDPKNLEDFDADTLFDGRCPSLKVGDKAEDALVCELTVRTSIMRHSAVAFVVRSKRIVSVLEAGLALPAMDWPDSRWLDLQLAFAPDGLEADVHDRAERGAVLVRAPSACKEYVALYLACEQAHRDGKASADLCPQRSDSSGNVSLGHWPPTPPESPMGGDSVPLKGCAEALPALDDLIKQSGAGGAYLAEFRADRAFAIKSCKARGRYVWRGERFVRATP